MPDAFSAALARSLLLPIRRCLAFLVMLAPMLSGGCSAVDVINALVPRDYRLLADQAYGDGPRRRLDVYMPQRLVKPAPIVVFFYGGEWQGGTKEMYRFVGQALASKGYVVVIPDYRVYPEVRYPAFLDDGAAALRWTVAHGAAQGGDPERIYVMGHSAGAYIAAMLALDGRWLARAGLDRHRIKGLIGLAGPYDFLPLTDPVLKIIFGPAADWPATQPIRHAGADAPPTLLIAGQADDVVSPGNSTRLAARLRAAGVPVTLHLYAGIGHRRIVGALAAPLRFLAPVLPDITAFMQH